MALLGPERTPTGTHKTHRPKINPGSEGGLTSDGMSSLRFFVEEMEAFLHGDERS
jgi:hypothetical protein